MAIQWVTKKRAGGNKVAQDADIYFATQRAGSPRAAFAFRNGAEKKITSLEYISVGYEDGKVYFIGADPMSGYKITRVKDANPSIKVNDGRLTRLGTKCFGGYQLQFDSLEGLYYIVLKENKNGKK